MVAHPHNPFQEVIDAARTGDADAFGALYDQYVGMVFHTAYHILGDRQQAEDVTHDVFVRVSQKLAQYAADRGAFSTWLHQITVNTCINTTKRPWTRWLSLDRATEEGHEVPAADAPPLDALIADEEHQHVRQAIMKLSIKLRTVIVLRYYRNLSYDEIAAVIGSPIGTVRSRLAAAHVQLHQELGEQV